VLVSQVKDTNGNDHLSFTYGAFSLTTREQDPKGVLSAPQTYGFDIQSGASITTPLAAATPGSSGGASNPTNYYLKVTGQDGGIVAVGLEGAFAVQDFIFNVTNPSSIGGGAGAGKANFDPLIVDLLPGTNLNGLLQSASTGRVIRSLQIEGVTVDGKTSVYDLRLADVLVSQVKDTNGNDRLAFTYGAFSLTTREQDSKGVLSTPQTYGFNIQSGASITAPLAAATPGSSGGASNPTSYYLKVTGQDGGIVVVGMEGAFAIQDFIFNVTNPSSIGGGAGAGKATFDPLIVDLLPGTNLNGLLQSASTGRVIRSLQIEGVTVDGKTTVYDLRLADVLVSQVKDTNGNDRLAFTYGAFSLTTREQDSKGVLSTPQTYGFNIQSGASITAPLAAATPGSSGGASNPTSYYLKVTGQDGGIVVVGLEGAFAVQDFVFNVTNPSSIGGGAGAGKANFDPLIVDLLPGTNLNGLLQSASTGRVIRSLQIEGVTVDGKTNVYDLRLADVLVSQVKDTNGNDHLSFTYGAFSLTTREQSPAGVLSAPQTYGFNIQSGTSITTPLAAATPSRTVAPVRTSDVATVMIDVTPINDAAVIGGITSGTINEDAVPNTITGQLTITDVDSPASFQSVLAAVASNSNYGKFTLTNAGEWNYTLDNANSTVNALSTGATLTDSFTVLATDGTIQTIGITINGFTDNTQPVITSNGGGDTAAIAIDENITIVTTISAIDPDPNTTLTYLIAGGADAALFDIDGTTGTLSFKTAANFEVPGDADRDNSYKVSVAVSDGAIRDTQDITVNVRDVNESPTAITLAQPITSLAENTSTTTRLKVSDIQVTDDALGTNSLSLSGADAGFFEIFNGSLYLKSGTVLDYETKNSYAVTVAVDDTTVGNTPDASTTYNLTLSDVMEVINGGTNASNNINGTIGGDIINGLGGSDTIRGGDGGDSIDGGTGADELYGDNGNDTIIGGTGADTIRGGDGGDSIDGGTGADELYGDNGNDTIIGGTGSDIIRGGEGNDSIDGGTGADELYGDSGNDTISGGDGADNLYGGADNDSLSGGSGNDFLSGASGNDTLLGGNGLDDLYGGDGDDILIGEAGDDYLNGENGNDYLDSGNGDDELYGGEGTDTLVGGNGSDLYFIDNANDIVIEDFNGGFDTVNSSVRITLANNVENLILTGSNAINGTGNNLSNNIIGNTGNNLLQGLDGNDTLSGGDGNDTLDGGNGTDNLFGGTGVDTFILHRTDTVGDFSAGEILQVSASAFGGGLRANVALLSNQLRVGANVTTANSTTQRFIYNTSNGDLFFDADGSAGNFARVRIGTLIGSPTLASSNFSIVL
jgi:VCBS repeat-containing protein